MIILGIDPGTLVTGYGVIEVSGGAVPTGSALAAPVAARVRKGSSNAITVIEYGTIESKKISSLPLRLRTIFTRLAAVIERTTPDELAIESAFYHKNVQSTLKLGHARGVAILAGVLKELPTAEYAPREIKRAVVGNGNASKDEVEYMVRTILALRESDRKLPDAYDALAVAITHAARRNASRGAGSGGSASGKSGAKGSTNAVRNWKQFVEAHPDRVKL